MAARTLPAPTAAGALVSRSSTSKELSKIDQIWFIVHATGSSEIYAEFNAKSISDLNDFITQKVNKIDGLLKTETSLVLKYIKRRYDWKTAIR
jgi:Lrp/AsnC family transcriptional regulator for asnA, asnC and gidA